MLSPVPTGYLRAPDGISSVVSGSLGCTGNDTCSVVGSAGEELRRLRDQNTYPASKQTITTAATTPPAIPPSAPEESPDVEDAGVKTAGTAVTVGMVATEEGFNEGLAYCC